MKIIYMHHAERDIGLNHNDPILRQEEDITELGIKEANVLAEKYKNKEVTAIVTSPYKRCVHTAEIINKYLNVPIIYDDRFNEMGKNEEWSNLLKRNMEAIDDITKKYHDDDTIICVTSGVNLSAFVCYFYGITPTNDVSWCQAGSISPVNFTIGKKNLD